MSEEGQIAAAATGAPAEAARVADAEKARNAEKHEPTEGEGATQGTRSRKISAGQQLRLSESEAEARYGRVVFHLKGPRESISVIIRRHVGVGRETDEVGAEAAMEARMGTPS